MKAKATKQTKLSLKRTAKEVAANPAAQIKKLFALVKEAREMAGHAQTLAREAACNGALSEQPMLYYPEQVQAEELAALRAEIAKLKACNTVGVRTAAQEREAAKAYVLTDADWRRVIDEKFLINTGGGYYSEVGSVPGREYREHYKLPNKPGVLQPYFGQGCPEEPGTRVLVKYRDGKHGISFVGGVDWTLRDSSNDIVAYMVEVPY